MTDFANVISWIEDHKGTVDLMKWGTLLIIGWWAGIFRFLRDFTRRPFAEIGPDYSFYFIEEHSVHAEVLLIAIVIDARIINPTKDKVGVVKFELSIGRDKWSSRWTPPLAAIGFPTMPAFPMPDNKRKMVPVWFSNFSGLSENFADMSHSVVDAQDSKAGLTLFVASIKKSSLAERTGVPVRLRARLATGQICSAIRVLTKKKELIHFEDMVLGGVAYVRHPSVWENSRPD
jgi:hypothetical protein